MNIQSKFFFFLYYYLGYLKFVFSEKSTSNSIESKITTNSHAKTEQKIGSLATLATEKKL